MPHLFGPTAQRSNAEGTAHGKASHTHHKKRTEVSTQLESWTTGLSSRMAGVTLGTCFNCKKQEDWAKVKRPFVKQHETSNRMCKLAWLSLQIGRELPSRAGKRRWAGIPDRGHLLCRQKVKRPQADAARKAEAERRERGIRTEPAGVWLPPPGSREMWGAWCRIRGSSSPCSLAGEQIKRLSHHPHRQHSNSSCESPVCPRRCPLISKLALLIPAGRGLSHPCAPSTHRFHIPVTPATVRLALRCLSTCRCICAESGTVRARPGPVDLGSHWHLAGCPALGSARSSLNVDFRKGQPNICCFLCT
nr:uncharacterized protein LOC105490191 isoform X1 [Macaca nemestrina]